MVAVDRERPYEFEYRGIKAHVHFQWGADNNSVPVGLYVMIEENKPVIRSMEKSIYSSFEHAKSRGVEMGKVDIDRILGNNPKN